MNRLSTILLLVAIAASQARVIIDPDVDQENRCGGPIEADEGTLTFPAPGQVTKPGEICIWTVHLQTTATFRLNFTQLDITGSAEDCLDGGVRLHSLTNLIPADRAESYTFCNDKPPTDGNFFLSESLLTVIYHSEEGSSGSGQGFTLNWQGIAVQPIPKNHESTYTSSPSGIIRYPVFGQYAPNQVNTWLVKGWDINPDLRLHLNVPYVNLETCNKLPAEDCLCDALILYEVTRGGVLSERTRLCGNVSDVEISDLGPAFILGFFTDHEDDGENGIGFEMTYRPEVPPTTPTTPTTSPRPPGSNISSSCGGLLFGTEGLIEYSLDENYLNFERCIWTVRTPSLKQIRFTINSMEMEPDYDMVVIHGLNASGLGERQAFTGASARTVLLNATVAIVIFHTDYSNTRKGFSMSFTAEGDFDDSLNYYEDFTTNNELVPGGSLSYPADGEYRNGEFSTFVFTRPTMPERSRVALNFTSIDLDVAEDGTCRDVLHVFYIISHEAYSLAALTPIEGICQVSQLSNPAIRYESIVLLLNTDSTGTANGLQLDWVLNSS